MESNCHKKLMHYCPFAFKFYLHPQAHEACSTSYALVACEGTNQFQDHYPEAHYPSQTRSSIPQHHTVQIYTSWSIPAPLLHEQSSSCHENTDSVWEAWLHCAFRTRFHFTLGTSLLFWH